MFEGIIMFSKKLAVAYLVSATAVAVVAINAYNPSYAITKEAPANQDEQISAYAIHEKLLQDEADESAEDIAKAKQELEQKIKDAESLLQQYPKLSSSGNMKESVKHAKYATEAQRISGAGSYTLESSNLCKAVESFNKDIEAYKAEQARIAAERAASARARQNDPYQKSSNGSVWSFNYYNDFGAAYADANGAMTQWKDGYYIAHDWSYNGKMIASKPKVVNVDGMLYRYIDSTIVSRDSTWGQISWWVYRNNGIGFQTCCSGGYLITHYEPI